jgi:hypothetical protein
MGLAQTGLGLGPRHPDLCIQLRLLALGTHRMGSDESLDLLIKGHRPVRSR